MIGLEIPLEDFNPRPKSKTFYKILCILFLITLSPLTIFLIYQMDVTGTLRTTISVSQVISKTPTTNITYSDDLYPFQFPTFNEDPEKKEAVKEAFLHSWKNYKAKCWGSDAIAPNTGSCQSIFSGGLFIIDAIDTLWLMDLKDDLKDAEKYFSNYKFNGKWSIFETIIRYLGGFISAYEITNSPVFYKRLKELGYLILPIISDVNGYYSGSLKVSNNKSSGSDVYGNLAEVGTYQLEFMKLTEITGDPKFIKKAMKVYKTIWKQTPNRGLITSPFSNNGDGKFGAAYDSYFEYIPKVYVLSNKSCPGCLERHLRTIKEIEEGCTYTTPSGTKLIGDRINGIVRKNVEHLATFLPGMIALGCFKEDTNWERHLKLAGSVVQSYADIFRSTLTKLMPETVRIDNPTPQTLRYILVHDEYMLRPETAESIYYMYRFTGEQKYRDMAWDLFKGINTSTREKYGFSNVRFVNVTKGYKTGVQESYFLAETLKYLYLTFSDSTAYDPRKQVFNTEAHFFKIWNESTVKKYGQYLMFDANGKPINEAT